SQFLGFVLTPPNGAWGGADFNSDEDTVFVFSTMVQSTSPVTIPLIWGGDDGSSVFLNGHFMGGGGFSVGTAFDLTVGPGAPIKLDLVGYNGPGPWVFSLLRRDTQGPLTSTPGVTVDASFPPINDDLDKATMIESLPVTDLVNTTVAATDPDDPATCNNSN